MAQAMFGGNLMFDHRFQDWSNFKLRLTQYCIANGVTSETDKDFKKQRALLITSLAEETFSLLTDLAYPDTLDKCEYSTIISILDAHFKTKKCVFAERFNFYKAEQKHEEGLAEWAARLRHLAQHCYFKKELEVVLRDKFVLGLENEKERERLFSEDPEKMSLNQALELAQSVRCARTAARSASSGASSTGEAGPREVFALARSGGVARAAGPPSGDIVPASNKQRCEVCGYYSHEKSKCRFINFSCKKCGKKGHLKRMCSTYDTKTKSNYFLAANSSDEVEGNTVLFNIRSENGEPFVENVSLGGRIFKCEIDSGSAVSAMSEHFYKQFFKDFVLHSFKNRLHSYSGDIIQPLGVISLPVSYNKLSKVLDICITSISSRGKFSPLPILGRDFMNKFKINLCNLHFINDNEISYLMMKYSHVFSEELGTLKNFEVKLSVKPDAKPIFFKSRPVPFALRSKLDVALNKLLDLGIIEPVDYSDFATPIIPVLKPNGDIRICGDYSVTLNKVLNIDKYPLPKIDELFSRLHGGQEFTKLDLSMAYLQLLLSKDSQHLTTINTHRGLFKYTRLVFGLSSAPAIFQKTMENILAGIDGVCIFLDDLLVTGPSKSIHLERLESVLARLQNSGLTVRKEKCHFFQQSVEYLGYVIDKHGLHTSPEKIRAIKEAKPPQNVAEVKSFLGMVNYYRVFVPNMSSILNPLNNLLKSNVKWEWAEAQQKSFDFIKKELQSERVLAHYNPELQTILSVDAGPNGLGAVLAQKQTDGHERVIAYASRSLSKSELAYSQIQKEATAIIFGIKKFHQYLYGRSEPFVLRTDHKPLLSIFGNKKGVPEMSANRLQRYALFLNSYNYVIQYIRSADNVADYLSRSTRERSVEMAAPGNVTDEEPVCEIEINSYLHFLSKDNDDSWSISALISEMSSDDVLKQVKEYIMNGWPRKVMDSRLLPYFKCRLQLAIEGDCIMRGHKVVVPQGLRRKVLEELHSSHLGVVKSKMEARSYVWWPGIDADIERTVGSCEKCCVLRAAPPRAPLAPWPYPAGPWERVHLDMLYVDGDYYLVIIDAFSKWLECFYLGDGIGSEAVIGKLSELMARFGIMRTIVTDNATAFTSGLFKKFCNSNGIQHLTIAPYHPASNGQAENSVKTVKKAIKILKSESQTRFIYFHKLNKFLLSYRNVPHCSTDISPAKLMLGRELRSRLNLIHPKSTVLTSSVSDAFAARDNVLCKQILQCKQYGGKRKLTFQVGDCVLVKRHYCNGNKHTWIKGTIVQKIGSRMYWIILPSLDITVKKHADQIVYYRGTNDTTPLIPSTSVNVNHRNADTEYSYISLPSGEESADRRSSVSSISVDSDLSASSDEDLMTADDDDELWTPPAHQAQRDSQFREFNLRPRHRDA